MLQFQKNKNYTMQIIKKLQTTIIKSQYFILGFLIILLPYWGFFEKFQHLSVIFFFLVLVSGLINIKNLLTNKIIISVSAFFLFSMLSILWSPAETVTWEYLRNLHNYKYYFVLLISIYSLSLSPQQIKNLFFIMALAPLGISVIYYLNAFSVTHIYSALFFHGNSNLLSHYLINNFFILYSATYFYVLFFDSISKQDTKKTLLSLFATLFFAISLLIDPLSVARLMLVAFLAVLLIVPLFYLPKKKALLIVLVMLIFGSIFISTNKKMQQGIKTVTTAIENEKYTGSWGHRLGFAIVGLKIYTEHPIIGRGINDVRARTIEFAQNNHKYFINDHNRHFHNEHINILVEVGLIGYILFAIFIYLFFTFSIKNEFLLKLKYTFIISFLVLMLGEHYLHNQQVGSFFFIFLSLMLLYHKQEKLLRADLI